VIRKIPFANLEHVLFSAFGVNVDNEETNGNVNKAFHGEASLFTNDAFGFSAVYKAGAAHNLLLEN
jgi:hypothetical protein